MINNEMTLSQMVNYKPSDMEMLNLPLDIVVYVKVSVISLSRDDNYDFIKFLFTQEDIKDCFKDIDDTIFYDFDGRHTDQEKYINIFELFSLYNFDIISNYLMEVLQIYTHEADVIIDFYTHDNKEFRLSNLDGIVKLEQMNMKNAA